MTANYQDARRVALSSYIGPDGIAIIPTAPERQRNRDSDFLYRHDSYFYYLTGFSEPNAWLVLSGDGRSTLFCADLSIPFRRHRKLRRRTPRGISTKRRLRLFDPAREDRGAAVALLLGAVPEEFVSARPLHVLDVPRVGLRFLEADHVRVGRLDVIEEALLQGGPHSVNVPGDDLHRDWRREAGVAMRPRCESVCILIFWYGL